jgi:hypothetical protein
MGSRILGIVAEKFLQHHGKLCMKHILENNKILYNNRCVDDILMLSNHNKVAEDHILNTMNNVHEIQTNNRKHWVQHFVFWM